MPLTKIVHFCGPEIYSLLCIVYAICLPLHLIFIRMTCLCNMCREIRHESGILSDVYVWLCVQYKNKNYLVFFVNKLYSINLYLLYCSSRLWSTTSAVLFSGWFIYTSTSSWIWKKNNYSIKTFICQTWMHWKCQQLCNQNYTALRIKARTCMSIYKACITSNYYTLLPRKLWTVSNYR